MWWLSTLRTSIDKFKDERFAILHQFLPEFWIKKPRFSCFRIMLNRFDWSTCKRKILFFNSSLIGPDIKLYYFWTISSKLAHIIYIYIYIYIYTHTHTSTLTPYLLNLSFLCTKKCHYLLSKNRTFIILQSNKYIKIVFYFFFFNNGILLSLWTKDSFH